VFAELPKNPLQRLETINQLSNNFRRQALRETESTLREFATQQPQGTLQEKITLVQTLHKILEKGRYMISHKGTPARITVIPGENSEQGEFQIVNAEDGSALASITDFSSIQLMHMESSPRPAHRTGRPTTKKGRE
jgi:hypothetical protein